MWVHHPSGSLCWSLLSPHRIIGIPRCAFHPSSQVRGRRPFVYLYLHSSTGSAGLIQTIRQFIDHHWAAAILGLIATVGWIIQGFGNAFYYRQANLLRLLAQQKGSSDTIPLDISTPSIRGPYNGKGQCSFDAAFIVWPNDFHSFRPKQSWPHMVQKHISREDERARIVPLSLQRLNFCYDCPRVVVYYIGPEERDDFEFMNLYR